MTDIVIVNNTKISTADNVTNIYTSPGSSSGTIVTAFTVSNSSAASASYKVYIVDATGVVGDPVSPQKIVVKDRFDSVPAIVNQVVPSGGSIRAENSTGDALNFFATGREQ